MKDHLISGFRTTAQLLVFLLVAAPASAQTVPTALVIVTIKGEGVSGRVRERTTEEPIICVLDNNEKPVSGAAVVFTLPTEGATGVFGNGSKTLTVLTDDRGTAVAVGLRFNQIPGKVQLHVNASYKGLAARTNITQQSEAPAGYKPSKGGGGKVIAILAVLGAGGAGGAFYALRKSGATPSAVPVVPTTIGITPGAGTLAPPR